jgi:hypothetical protein
VIELAGVERGQYFRLQADVIVDGHSAVQHMLASGHARPSSPETGRQPWQCKGE